MRKQVQIFILAILLGSLACLQAQTPQQKTLTEDSIRLSLLTCGPGQEIYSLFGHTAIRYEDRRRGIDVVFNYGLFNFQSSNFILRFTLGETDYQLGAMNYRHFLAEYQLDNRNVWEQTLNLTTEEKQRLISQLQENYRPENRVYRYNFFYDNCATRPRDQVERAVGNSLRYDDDMTTTDTGRSFRDIVHQYCEEHPWAQFGIDLCIGSKADRPISRRQMMFAPFYLKDFFAGVNIDLVDFKIEFGKTADGTIVLADEISPDTCRFWDKTTHEKLDKDRFRRDMGGVEEAYGEMMRRVFGE